MGARVTMHTEAIDRFLTGPTGPVFQKVAEITRRTEALAKITCPVDTGRLRNTGTSSVQAIGRRVHGRVEFTAGYSLVVHEGHGVITPKNAQVLVFRVGGQLVYAKRVRAVAGRPWLVDALEAVSPWPVVRA